MNLVETFEKPNFNQSCVYGNLIEGHAVYCHCKNINAPRKCKRTWYTKGIIKDEDCQFYKPNRLINVVDYSKITKNEEVIKLLKESIKSCLREVIEETNLNRVSTAICKELSKPDYSLIYLADVLRWHGLGRRSKYSHFEVANGESYFSIYNGVGVESIIWDLTKPYLHEQSKELISWLTELI